MPDSIRTYDCFECGLIIDRDVNAAINIQVEGLRLLNLYIEQLNKLNGCADSPVNDVSNKNESKNLFKRNI